METVLVTGANRGIGLEFCRQYAHSGHNVLACCRIPQQADQLNQLAQQFHCIKPYQLDVAKGESISQLAFDLSNTAIDLLINNAGVYGDDYTRGFGQLDYQRWLEALSVNTLAPIRVTEALLPNLLAGTRSLVVAMTSKMGSMADNHSGGALLYRSSKAGLNAAMKSLSLDLAHEKIGVLIVHPGWVQTDMGGPNGLISSQTSVKAMRRLISQFEITQTGLFMDYSGKSIPW